MIFYFVLDTIIRKCPR